MWYVHVLFSSFFLFKQSQHFALGRLAVWKKFIVFLKVGCEIDFFKEGDLVQECFFLFQRFHCFEDGVWLSHIFSMFKSLFKFFYFQLQFL